jgi:hypothetical protein
LTRKKDPPGVRFTLDTQNSKGPFTPEQKICQFIYIYMGNEPKARLVISLSQRPALPPEFEPGALQYFCVHCAEEWGENSSVQKYIYTST